MDSSGGDGCRRLKSGYCVCRLINAFHRFSNSLIYDQICAKLITVLWTYKYSVCVCVHIIASACQLQTCCGFFLFIILVYTKFYQLMTIYKPYSVKLLVVSWPEIVVDFHSLLCCSMQIKRKQTGLGWFWCSIGSAAKVRKFPRNF